MRYQPPAEERRPFPALAAVAIGLMVLGYLLLDGPPTVKLTWPGRECVEVVPAGAGTCDNLPQKYEIQWVSPELERGHNTRHLLPPY